MDTGQIIEKYAGLTGFYQAVLEGVEIRIGGVIDSIERGYPELALKYLKEIHKTINQKLKEGEAKND